MHVHEMKYQKYLLQMKDLSVKTRKIKYGKTEHHLKIW